MKQQKHALLHAAVNFGVRAPYTVLVDGEFVKAVLAADLQLTGEIAHAFNGEPAHCKVTRCTVAALKAEANQRAFKFARKMRVADCAHAAGAAVAPKECLLSLLADGNPLHFCLAANDEALRRAARLVPGVPICFFHRGFAALEKVSKASDDVVSVRARLAKKQAREDVKAFLARPAALLTAAEYASQQASAAAKLKPPKPVHKGTIKKLAKAPNPLAMKKKKRPAPADAVEQPKKKKRRRAAAAAAAAVPVAAAADAVSAVPAVPAPPANDDAAAPTDKHVRRRIAKKRGSRGGKRTHTAASAAAAATAAVAVAAAVVPTPE